MYAAIKIHNNSVSNIKIFQNFADAEKCLISLVESQLERELNESELENLDNWDELYYDEDADNIYTYSINAID